MICDVYVRRSVEGSTTRAANLYSRMNIGDGPRKWASEHADDLGEGTFVFIDTRTGNVYVLRIERIPQPTHRVMD